MLKTSKTDNASPMQFYSSKEMPESGGKLKSRTGPIVKIGQNSKKISSSNFLALMKAGKPETNSKNSDKPPQLNSTLPNSQL
jgi:hypothetical protein